jgi:hypothetical protein
VETDQLARQVEFAQKSVRLNPPKVSPTQLAQFHLAKPAWLDWVRYFALLGGPVVAATGLWLLFRR